MDVAALVEKLSKAQLSVATAESCTGGLIASSIVDVPGASDCFNEGYITYSNEAKMKNLGVRDSKSLRDNLFSFCAAAYQAIFELSGTRWHSE